MKKTVYLLILTAILFSCTHKKKTTISNTEDIKASSTNALLPTKVIVYNEVNFTQQSIPKWTEGVDSIYMKLLNMTIIKSDLQVFSSNVYYSPELKVEMTDNDILSNMNEGGKVTSLYFIESWFFDKTSYQLIKNIEAWSPVYEYYKKNENGLIDSTKRVKKLLYDVREKSTQENEKLIAKDIVYEVNLNNTEYKTNEYLNLNQLTHLIIDPVLNGEKKVFDFFDETEMSVMDVKYVFGYGVDSLETEDPETGKWSWETVTYKEDLSNVEAFIFVEDWYIDQKTFAIRKEIKKIAPVIVKLKIDENGQTYSSKKIAFVVKI